ncbi:glutathione S-transferase family protein [Henriciella aquimarina]|uniref:glutathione S-transferase family protein n=1 Tax=Henriciella aquimarina TaxID=545261 RepID=UPI000A0038CE|nr:glutathione S-transferase family protein [Henriciella aquimarina]
MKRLWQWPIDPLARTVRLMLGEKRCSAELILALPWAQPEVLADMAPGARAPVLIDTEAEEKVTAIGTHAICEYLETAHPTPRLLPFVANERAEARRLWRWSEDSFAEVNALLLTERVNQWVRRVRQPDSEALRKGVHALKSKMTFLNGLAEMRPYMAGRSLTLADLSVAAHLSACDYFGDVPWDLTPDLKDWYARIKSRPSFRPLLADKVEGTRPARHYADLDF